MASTIERSTNARQRKAQARAEHLVAEAWDKLHFAEIELREAGLAVDIESPAIRTEIIELLDRMGAARIERIAS